MSTSGPVIEMNKLARIWSDRREAHILVQLSYRYEDSGHCRIYTLGAITHLDGH